MNTLILIGIVTVFLTFIGVIGYVSVWSERK